LKRPASPCVALVGTCDPPLAAVISEVVGELGATLDTELRDLSPALVLAVVGPDDVVQVLTAARLLAGSAPVIAVMAIGDDRVIERALTCGAAVCHALDTPFGRLRMALGSLLDR
jgi:hypothetical protein